MRCLLRCPQFLLAPTVWLCTSLRHRCGSSLPLRFAVITDCLQGELEVVTEAGTGKAKEAMQDATDHVPFLMLGEPQSQTTTRFMLGS